MDIIIIIDSLGPQTEKARLRNFLLVLSKPKVKKSHRVDNRRSVELEAEHGVTLSGSIMSP